MKKIAVLTLALFLLLTPKLALAFPSLQVYLPCGTAGDYGEDQDTWINEGVGIFDLYVVGSYKQGDTSITDGVLLVTVPQGMGGSISIDGLAAGAWHSDLSFLPATMKDLNHYPLNKPSEFDYYTFDIGSFAMGTSGVHNYDADGIGSIEFKSSQIGEEKQLKVTVYDHDYVHFDVYAKFNDSEWRSNPGSHDSMVHMPEPASMLLFGLGALGFGVIRRKRKI